MFDSRSVEGFRSWALVAAGCIVFGGCGGTVRGSGATREGDGGPSGGGALGAGGHAGRSPGGMSGTGGKAGSGAGGTKACPPPLTRCPLGCVDLQSDSSDCGMCNATCASDSKCVNGACLAPPPPGVTCSAGTTYCSNYSKCLDLQSNPFACGSCNNFCTAKEACIDGICAPGTCFAGLTACGNGVCSDMTIDPNNCGACGNQCSQSQTCTNGKCADYDCGGPPAVYCEASGCVDTSTDVSNCGQCNNPCPGAAVYDYSAYSCTNGKCGCAPLANSCGEGSCASQFWYCPPAGFTGSPSDFCMQTARNPFERCACSACLVDVTSCAGSKACVNAMDCALNNVCIGCSQPFNSCSDQGGRTDPLADKLIACMNTACAAPPTQ